MADVPTQHRGFPCTNSTTGREMIYQPLPPFFLGWQLGEQWKGSLMVLVDDFLSFLPVCLQSFERTRGHLLVFRNHSLPFSFANNLQVSLINKQCNFLLMMKLKSSAISRVICKHRLFQSRTVTWAWWLRHTTHWGKEGVGTAIPFWHPCRLSGFGWTARWH